MSEQQSAAVAAPRSPASATCPLAGIRVLDLSSMLAGPYCGRWLADLGAEVVKIESPEGDYMRTRPPLRDGHSAYFGHLNAGKHSLAVDLKLPEGAALVRRLAGRADVLLQGFRPGVAERLGLGYERLAADSPRLVYCSISGFGQSGPMAQAPAYAAIVHAASGFDSVWRAGQPAGATLPACAVQIADFVAAANALIGIQSALIARASTGRGSHVDVSMLEGMLAMMPFDIVQAQFPEQTLRTAYRPLRARDAEFVVMPLSPGNFFDLCNAIGQPELPEDPRFATSIERVRHWDALMTIIEEWACRHTAARCVALLEEAGVPAARYASLDECLQAAQVAHRGSVGPVTDGGGQFLAATLPFLVDDRRPGRDGQPPRVPVLGEHTRRVLSDWLGLAPRDIGSLHASGAVVSATHPGY